MAHPLQECTLYKGEFLSSRIARAFLAAYSCLNLKQIVKNPQTVSAATSAVETAKTSASADFTWSGPEGQNRTTVDYNRGRNYRGTIKRKNNFNDFDWNYRGRRGFY